MKIKFRVWDGKKMHYDDYCIFGDGEVMGMETTGDCNGRGDNIFYRVTTYYDKAELIGMLWTGLQDKNGKDIYEGDVVEFDEAEWGGGPSELRRWVVSWERLGAQWDTGGGTNGECNDFKTVIGNVHEDGELL